MEKWFCNKCNCINQSAYKCPLCGTDRPNMEMSAKDMEFIKKDQDISQKIHNKIQMLTYSKKVKLWRWMEDHII